MRWCEGEWGRDDERGSLGCWGGKMGQEVMPQVHTDVDLGVFSGRNWLRGRLMCCVYSVPVLVPTC